MAAAAPAPAITVFSWNIQILGKVKGDRSQLVNMLAQLIKNSGADVVTIQEIVFAAGKDIEAGLLAALADIHQTWKSCLVQAITPGPDGDRGDRDGYLFLWRSDKYTPLVHAGKAVGGTFTGTFPLGWTKTRGRRPGYVGLTRLDGSFPFIVASYHAPPGAPADAMSALQAELGQLLSYPGGNYSAWFLCGDFNLDINAFDEEPDEDTDMDTADGNLTRWYKPLLDKIGGAEATRANTCLMTVNRSRKMKNKPDSSVGYAVKALDNILAGPSAKVRPGFVIDTIDQLKAMRWLADGFIGANNLPMHAPSTLAGRFEFARTYLSDHLPVVAVLNI